MSSGLQLADLLLDLDEVAAELTSSATAGEWLDAFLLAAAAVQIVEDHLQPDSLVRRAAGMLAGLRDALADAVMTGDAAATGIGDIATQVAAGVADLPRPARAAVLRLPSAFRAFDLAPADAATLARGLRERAGAAPVPSSWSVYARPGATSARWSPRHCGPRGRRPGP